MKLKKVKSLKQLKNIYKLYNISFPKEEKKPFWLILVGLLRGNFEMFSIEKESKFKGLAITLKHKDLTLLDYLAVLPLEKRKGYGSKALSYLKEYYKNYRFFLEIENSDDKMAENYEERQNRKRFYIKNGFSFLPFNVNLFGVEMEILGNDCSFTFEEYLELYKNQFGGYMKKIIIANLYNVERNNK